MFVFSCVVGVGAILTTVTFFPRRWEQFKMAARYAQAVTTHKMGKLRRRFAEAGTSSNQNPEKKSGKKMRRPMRGIRRGPKPNLLDAAVEMTLSSQCYVDNTSVLAYTD